MTAEKAMFDAWVLRGDPWPTERAWAETQPSIGAAWDSCGDGRWMESAAKRLGFWSECDGVRSMFDATLVEAARAYDADRKVGGQPAAMEAYDARVKVSREAFATVMRAAVSRRAIEAALASWWEREKAIDEKIRERRERDGGVYRGADDWSELPRNPEAA